MPDIYQELTRLAESEMYPFHMPGHKRNLESTPMKGAFRCDITEIDGYDNLHDASGIIKEAQERASKLYGSDETFFVVNGSTAGVLSAVSAVLNEGETVLAARGSHKSFYHAVYLRNLNVKYLPFKKYDKYDMPDVYTEEDIEAALDDSVKAVFITSPTYEGRCSDISEISKICHSRNIPLIVDAAHGAHFGFGNKNTNSQEYSEVPQNAVAQGADIVIHSVHKTLPSMTQTALVHICGELVDRDRVKRFLRIYQSSSPSYILMSSIDLCIKEMAENGDNFIEKLLYFRNKIQNATKECKYIKILGKNVIDDPAKVVICSEVSTMTGQKIYDILREEFDLQLEMAAERYALAIISGWDTEDGIDRLIYAVKAIDKRLSNSKELLPEIENSDSLSINSNKIDYNSNIEKLPDVVMTIKNAWDADHELVPIDGLVGRISAEFVNLYPPGIPILAPGELFTTENVSRLNKYIQEGLNLQGIHEFENKDIVERGFLCVKQK